MKRLVWMLVLLLTVLAGAPVLAQDEGGGEDLKTKFYNFDEMLIDGEVKKPSGLLTNVRDQASFNRLLKLKKKFLPELKRSAKESTLK